MHDVSLINITEIKNLIIGVYNRELMYMYINASDKQDAFGCV